MASTGQLKVFLAGRVAIEGNGVLVDEGRLAGRQGRLVFAYLVAEQGRPVPRDELADALWGETPPATWDKALSVIASKLRGALAAAGVDGAGSLTSAFGCYRLELPEGSWVDVVAARAALQNAETALAVGEHREAKDEATLVAALAGEPFLPGDDGAWVEEKRRELTNLRARACAVLADACAALGETPEAVAWAEQAASLQPFREAGYRRLMELHVLAGNRAEGLRVYERCRRLLADELGAYPSPETESLYRDLLQRSPAPRPAASASTSPRRRIAGAGRRALLALAAAGVLGAAAIAAAVLSRGGSQGVLPLRSVDANAVAALDPSTGRRVGLTPLDASPSAIAYGDGAVWVAMTNQDSVSRIDPKTSAVQQTIPVGNGPSAVTVGGGFVWVANSLDGTISQIDPRTNGGQVVRTIGVGNGPTGVAYGLGGLWVANSVDRTIERIDPVSDEPGKPIPIDDGADAIAVGDGSVWVTGRAAGVLSRFDLRTGSVVPINVGNGPAAVATSAGAVWVATSLDATVWRIDPATNRVKATVAVGDGPSGIAVASHGKLVWVANALSGSLSEIDTADDDVVDSIPVGEQPQGVAVGADGSYVALQGTVTFAHRGGTLTVAVPGHSSFYFEPLADALDPASGEAPELITITNDGLLGYGRAAGAAGYTVVADLAVALPTLSDGGRTYTFQLRPGIRYTTGALVRPADVRRGIERALLLHGRQSYFLGIVGAARCVAVPERCNLSRGIVTRRGTNSLVIHLTAPDPDFLYKLALPEADVAPAGTPLRGHALVPATGPYEVVRVDAKRGVIVLGRNPRFHLWSAAAQPEGFPDRIVERFGYTGETAVRAVEAGRADVTSNGLSDAWSPGLASTLRTRDSSRLYTTPTLILIGVWLNTRLPPFNDVRVRQAVNYAVDRNHLANLAGGPAVAAAGCQLLPPGVEGYRPYCPFTVHPDAAGDYHGPDLAKARRLVTASGTEGERVTVWFYNIGIGRRNSTYLVSVLRSLGYRARRRLLPQTGQLWRANRQAGPDGIGPNLPSADDALAPYFTCSSYVPDPDTNENNAEFCNRRIDAEIAHARAVQITDPNAASPLWTKIDRQLTRLAPWIVTRENLAADLVSRRTHNYTPCWLSFGYGVTDACLDQLWVH